MLDDGTARIHWRGEPVYILAGLGSFAEYAVVREASCVPIGGDVPLDVAALVGCAVATGVGAAMYTPLASALARASPSSAPAASA